MDQRLSELIDTLTDPLHELASFTEARLSEAIDRLKTAADELRRKDPATFTDDDTADAEKIAAAYEVLAEEQQRRADAKPTVRRPSIAELAATKTAQPGPVTRTNPTCGSSANAASRAHHARRSRRGVRRPVALSSRPRCVDTSGTGSRSSARPKPQATASCTATASRMARSSPWSCRMA